MPLPKNETHIHLTRTMAINAAERSGLDPDELRFYRPDGGSLWGWMPLEDAETMEAADSGYDPIEDYETVAEVEEESPHVPHPVVDGDEPDPAEQHERDTFVPNPFEAERPDGLFGIWKRRPIDPDSEADNWEQDEADAVRASADPEDDGDEGDDDMSAEAIMARNAARRSTAPGHDEDEQTQQAEAVSEPEPAKPVEPLKLASVTPAPANDDAREAHPGDHIATTGPMTPAMAQLLAAEIAKRTGRTIYIRDAFSLEVKGSVEPRLKLVGGHGLSDQQITLIELCSRQDENGDYIGATGQELLEAGAAEKPKKGGQSINWRAKALACEKHGYDFDINARRVTGTTKFDYLYILRPRTVQAAG